MRVTNGILLGCPLLLPVGTVNCVQTLKASGGQTTIESSMRTALIEHLNSEIVLGTIDSITSAIEWLKETFFFIRARKDPITYLNDCSVRIGFGVDNSRFYFVASRMMRSDHAWVCYHSVCVLDDIFSLIARSFLVLPATVRCIVRAKTWTRSYIRCAWAH
jgi:hypothetical protein